MRRQQQQTSGGRQTRLIGDRHFPRMMEEGCSSRYINHTAVKRRSAAWEVDGECVGVAVREILEREGG